MNADEDVVTIMTSKQRSALLSCIVYDTIVLVSRKMEKGEA